MPARLATILGFGAVALWSLLSFLTVATGPVPPFQLLAMTFAIGGGLGALSWTFRPGATAALRQRPHVWALGIAGLFGYHALYFAALKLAPPAESGLINYLWPLLIVLFSATLPGERLLGRHVLGALLGFAGVIVLVAGRGALDWRDDYLAGYLCAGACAFVWAAYSVLSRRVAEVSTDAVTGFCLATAALGLLCHLAFERTVWPPDAGAWAAVVASGLGPVGGAFYLWDAGMKRGDIRLLGVGSYAIPVASTFVLVLAGYAEPTRSLALACGLIAAGAVVASLPAASSRARASGRASAG
ncbi:MAG: EamA family transporter [Methylobacteriaceae bacterium]|nr:EamA family transporter [Methylobacteriaceae bacterium]